jgi:hypothetical protein
MRKTRVVSKSVVTHWLNMATQEEMKTAKACQRKSTLAKPSHFAPISPMPNSSSVACVSVPSNIPTNAAAKTPSATKTPAAAKTPVTIKKPVATKKPAVAIKTPVAPRKPTALALASMPAAAKTPVTIKNPVATKKPAVAIKTPVAPRKPTALALASMPAVDNSIDSYDDACTPVRPMFFTPPLTPMSKYDARAFPLPSGAFACPSYDSPGDDDACTPVRPMFFTPTLTPMSKYDARAFPLPSGAFACPSYDSPGDDDNFFTPLADFDTSQRFLCAGCMSRFHVGSSPDRCLGYVPTQVKNLPDPQLPDIELKMPLLSENAEQHPPPRSAVASLFQNTSAQIPPSYFTTYYGPLSKKYLAYNKVLNFMLGGNAAALKQNKTGNTLLHDAAKEGDLSKIAYLLTRGMLVAARNFRNETPEFCATIMGNSYAAALLQSCSRH